MHPQATNMWSSIASAAATPPVAMTQATAPKGKRAFTVEKLGSVKQTSVVKVQPPPDAQQPATNSELAVGEQQSTAQAQQPAVKPELAVDEQQSGTQAPQPAVKTIKTERPAVKPQTAAKAQPAIKNEPAAQQKAAGRPRVSKAEMFRAAVSAPVPRTSSTCCIIP